MAKSGVKFKDTMAAYDRLRGEIAGRKFAPVYLLMGEEAFFIDALCDLLASTILQESERAFNQLTVYGRDSDAGQVVNLCRQMPMMEFVPGGDSQGGAATARSRQTLAIHFETLATTILIVCHKEKNVDKRSQLYKSIAQHGAVLESVRPRDYEIGPWLAQFVASKGCTIDAKAQAMLTDHLGTDLAKISNELGKLLLSLPEGTKKITDAHIEQNIGISKDFNNFELCKAVTGQNLEQALRIADHFARNPKDNPLLVTILALFNQFREIFRINYLRWLSRHKGVPFPSDTELIGILRMNNAYALGELKQTSARWDNRRVFRILGLLREYDAKSKGMNAGGAPDGELLRELLLKIFLQ
ncbi:MAG: DNA polymerase III subunit delta [Alistipes putredinis]